MPNWCSINIQMIFENQLQLDLLQDFFDKKTDDDIFFHENKEKNIGLCIFNLNTNIDKEKLKFYIKGQTKWNFEDEKIETLTEILKKFHVVNCYIKFAERGVGFLGEYQIKRNLEVENEIKKILDIKLYNNEKSLINNIEKFIEPKYEFHKLLDIDDLIEEMDIVMPLDENDEEDYDNYNELEEEWFIENDMEDFYYLWNSSG